jgi:hypothetical protein
MTTSAEGIRAYPELAQLAAIREAGWGVSALHRQHVVDVVEQGLSAEGEGVELVLRNPALG